MGTLMDQEIGLEEDQCLGFEEKLTGLVLVGGLENNAGPDGPKGQENQNEMYDVLGLENLNMVQYDGVATDNGSVPVDDRDSGPMDTSGDNLDNEEHTGNPMEPNEFSDMV